MQSESHHKKCPDEKMQSHILDEIASQKSEEDYQEAISYDGSSSESSDDELDERKMLQYLRHKLRLEVEKSVFALIEGEPELTQIKDHIQELQKEEEEQIRRDLHIADFIKLSPEVKKEAEEQKSEDEQEYFDVNMEDEVGKERIEHSQHIDVYVSMKDANLPPQPINQQHIMMQSHQNLRSSMIGQNLKQSMTEKLTSFKKFFQKKQLPLDKQQYCMIIDEQPDLYIENAPTNNYCTLRWHIQNQAQVSWPSGAQLVLVYSNPVALVEA